MAKRGFPLCISLGDLKEKEGGGKGVVVPALQGSPVSPGKGLERGCVSSFLKISFFFLFSFLG